MLLGVTVTVLVGPWVSRNTWALWLGAGVASAAVLLSVGIWLRLRRMAAYRQLELTRSVTITDGMSGPQFEQWLAALMRRDGFRKVVVSGGAGDRGADLVAIAPGGARTVVQCKRYAPGSKVSSPDVQRFAGTVYALHRADVALLVTTGGITAPAARIAAQLGITVVTRHELMRWAAHGAVPVPD